MITVAGEMSIEYEKQLDKSDKIIKGYEEFIGEIKMIY